MKIDVVSIFPDYLRPLELSLVGRAASSGVVTIGVHDLRDWTHDRHRTVDDTPYGGGAGMVMRPEPWGEALDALAGPDTTLIIPTPSGEPLTQALAEELSHHGHLLIACGRYEGIDARVADHARSLMTVREISLGDFVVNGGEVAALAIVEAVVRLVPGVVGNPASLAEESHSADLDHLLEYPGFTKPPSWRGLDVPEILLSGNHAAIATWRQERAVERTRERRPELLRDVHADVVVTPARVEDAGSLYTTQQAAFVSEASLVGTLDIPPLTETVDEVRAAIAASIEGPSQIWVARLGSPDGRLVGAVRGSWDATEEDTWYVGRLLVAPDQQGRGIGGALMAAVEAKAPPSARRFRLFTAESSRGNHRFYKRLGYRRLQRLTEHAGVPVVILGKDRAG